MTRAGFKSFHSHSSYSLYIALEPGSIPTNALDGGLKERMIDNIGSRSERWSKVFPIWLREGMPISCRQFLLRFPDRRLKKILGGKTSMLYFPDSSAILSFLLSCSLYVAGMECVELTFREPQKPSATTSKCAPSEITVEAGRFCPDLNSN